MMPFLFRSPALLLACSLLGAFLPLPAPAQDTVSNQGGDLAFGGPGSGPGEFLVLQDIAFDARGVLYALDGVRLNNQRKVEEGNLRVQKFDRGGQLLGTIDLKSALGIAWSDKVAPQRIAADAAGQVFVTVPALGKVLQWSAAGVFLRAIEVPRAMAIATMGQGNSERVVVIPSAREALPRVGWTWMEGDKIVVLNPRGVVERTISLPRSYENVEDLTVDRNGNFLVKAEPNAIYQFSPHGKLLNLFGGNPTTRNPDGSEVLHTVGADSAGNVFTFAWGNPSLLTRFDADGHTVTQREGQFKWADPWGAHSRYTPLAIDPDDRVWVAATGRNDPSFVHYQTQRAVPAIIRTRADFFAPSNSVHQTPLRGLGFKAAITCGLPQNVSYDLRERIPMEFVVAAANRHVTEVTARWRVFDALKTEVWHGELHLPLAQGAEARAAFWWTPPRFGAYFVQVGMTSPDGDLGALGEHVGVTPRFPGLPELPAGARGGWADPVRQMWTGLPNERIHPGFRAEDKPEERAKKMDALGERITAAEQAGVTFLVQLVDSQKNFRAVDTTAIMERFKGRIKYLEVCNEPNFSGSVDDYFQIHQAAYAAAKAADPAVQVMGPATVNIDLRWLARLYELGFKDVSDLISVHDYEGHESVDPGHWRWKFGEARRIMAAHDDAAKPIWQTERAMAGVRGNNFMGLVQAIRMSLHRDLLETLGIPSAHNFHYYLNQGGYSSVPTYVWSAQGPMPGALAMRTRHALTAALGRTFAGELDFGPTGSTLYQGVRYAGANGDTVVLRTLGAPAESLEFQASGTSPLETMDAWGNAASVAPQAGRFLLELGQLPRYVRLAPGQTFSAPVLDAGRNLAPRAEFTYSARSKNSTDLLHNGIVESYQSGDPHGDTNGDKIWQGDLPSPGQTLEMRFPRPLPVSQVILRTPRADNAFTTLLDYDLEAWVDDAWKPLASVHRPMPPSEPAVTADATSAIWMDDTNVFPHRFAPITTGRLRLVARQTTHGFVPDDRARAWANLPPQKLMLREVEIYGPSSAVRLEGQLAGEGVPRTLQVSVENRGSKPIAGQLQAFAARGWAVPATTPISIAAGATQALALPLTPPAVLESSANSIDLELRTTTGELLDTAFVTFTPAPPMELSPQPANAAETTGDGALVRLGVRNLAAGRTGGRAWLRLHGPREMKPLEQALGPYDAGSAATLSWRVPGLDLARERWQAEFEIVANGVRLTARRDLFGQAWAVAGPFPRGFEVAEGPEKAMKFDPAEMFPDQMGNERRWRTLTPRDDGMVNLADALKPNTDVMAYAVTIVTSPRAQKALFSVGTDDGGKGWLNGRVVYSDDASHGAVPGHQQIPVELAAGRNEVWLKVTQGTGGWAYFFDLLDPQTGNPLPDLTYRAAP